MKQLTSAQLREMFQKFMESKGCARIQSASVIPENDPTVLFTTAGMHPLVPYLMGAKHPAGTRLTDVQKCIRTGDIDDVGDPSHLTFFEMLGNWSLGDYFKKEAISWSWEFLTSPEYLGLDKDRLAFSVFAGNEDCPRDEESHDLWRSMGVAEDHIFYLPKENNWWGPAGITGPCGPDTEMFIITDKEPCGPDCSPACSCGRYLEIWNDVFMQYNKQADGTFVPLAWAWSAPSACSTAKRPFMKPTPSPASWPRLPSSADGSTARMKPRTRPSALLRITCAPPPLSWGTTAA